jgi:tyrosinase
VQCALLKPAITPSTAAPGALSRYDDLVATHINQTMSIHFVGHFLPWHRLFTASYEKLLRDECGYRGAQPYWDWTLDTPAFAFVSSPLFDAVYGFGLNGARIPVNQSNNEVPGRTGGGCVMDGPFRNMTVHLGPFASLARNDQCLRRDLAPGYAAEYLGRDKLDLVLGQKDYGWFARTLEGGTAFNESQIHAGGQ